MAIIPHDGKKNPGLPPETWAIVHLREDADPNSKAPMRDPCGPGGYGVSEGADPGSPWIDGDWWVWPEGSDRWFDVVAYEIVEDC